MSEHACRPLGDSGKLRWCHQRWWPWLALLSLVPQATSPLARLPLAHALQATPLYLNVTPPVVQTSGSTVRVEWPDVPPQAGDWVGVFDGRPGSSRPLTRHSGVALLPGRAHNYSLVNLRRGGNVFRNCGAMLMYHREWELLKQYNPQLLAGACVVVCLSRTNKKCLVDGCASTQFVAARACMSARKRPQ